MKKTFSFWRSFLRWSIQWGNLETAYWRLSKGAPFCLALSLGASLVALWQALCVAPIDYQQREAFRIIYVHVPLAFYSMGLYSALAIFSAIYLIWRIKIAALFADACVQVGVWITFLALVTGAIWGKPMWGAWWIWDARLTSELILWFLYVGNIALKRALQYSEVAHRVGALVALIGIIDLPIIHFSVYWWQTLHQGPSVLRFAKPSIALAMLWPLLYALFAFLLVILTLVMLNARLGLLRASRGHRWVRSLS